MNNRERQIFEAALEFAEPERERFLAEACADDEELRARVEGLLTASESAGGFLGGHEVELGEQVGTRVGPYTLVEKIGEGGFGVVYRAEQEQPMRRSVALKILKLGMDTRAVVARFEAERQALALMNHPHIARVLDGGATPAGRPYFVMELVSGKPITTFCREERVELRTRLGIFLQACRAVQHAHQKGVIHRDLKPSNILVGRDGEQCHTKVIDFGIAKAARGAGAAAQFTALHVFMGSPAYTSPEQLDGLREDVDTRSDVFSLGAVLYELLVGVPPFERQPAPAGSTPPMAHHAKRPDPLPPSQRLRTLSEAARIRVSGERGLPPARLAAELKGDLDQIVLKCLEADRARRYDSAEDLARDLENFLRCEPVLARPATLRYRLGKFVRRNKLAVAIGGSAVLALAAVIGFYTHRLATERDLAQRASKRTAAMSELLMLQLGVADPMKVYGAKDLEETLASVRRDFADDPAMQVEILSTTGRTLSRRGQRALAEQLLGEALVFSRQLPTPTIYLGKVLEDLATIAREKGDVPGAIRYGERAVKVRRALMPKEGSNELANTLVELGRTYVLLDQYEQAETLFLQALDLRRQTVGPEHGDVSTNLGDLADVAWQLGRPRDALALSRQSVEMFRRTAAAEHPNVASGMGFISRVLIEEGDAAAAEKLLDEAIAMDTRLLGEKHWRTVRLRGLRAMAWRELGRMDAADRELHEVVALLNADAKQAAPQAAFFEVELGRLLLRRQGFQEAESVLRSALAKQQRIYAAHSWRMAITHSLLGEALLGQQRFAEAESLLLAALADMPDVPGPRGRELKPTRERLVRARESLEQENQTRAARPRSP